MAIHPLDPLSPVEISSTAQLVRDTFPNHTLTFRAITLVEPAKKTLIPYLDAERNGTKPLPSPPPRVARVLYYLDNPTQFRELRVDLSTNKVFGQKTLNGKHAFVDAGEMKKCEAACLGDSGVQEVIRELELPDGAVVVCDAWTYSPDGMNDMSRRVVMCFMYMKLQAHGDANHYAFPLDIVVELDDHQKVMQILKVPSGEHDRMLPAKGNVTPFDRRKLHTDSEYHPDLVSERRTTTKPYQVVQPQGPSFTTEGNLVHWEKWRFRVGFNYREGLTIHDVSYDGRQLFYRLSCSEMFVPYADPRAPYPRKAAFDFGNNGAGVNANNLALGCDCLGHIKYFDAYHHTNDGVPVLLPRVVCCHEADDGILWKHTNYRTGNAVVARSRILVLQTIITVSNYEYIFAFSFTQAAEINYEVRATGILSTNPIDLGDSVPYGICVAPGVMAPYHQHLFSLRIDPAIDGHENSLLIEESVAMPIDDPNVHNPVRVGYVTNKEYVEHETPLDTDNRAARVFKIVNENVVNPVTGTPVGYKLVPHYSQMLLAHPSSYHAVRSEFGAYPVWVTAHADDELFAAGEYTLQAETGSGLATWIKSREAPKSVRNTDLVLWHTFGTTHNPRVEDWPVMPVEKMMVSLKPVNFFTRNPALDVPLSNQGDNKSVLVTDCCAKPAL